MGIASLACCSALLFASTDGKALYREHCAGCHGDDGGGDGPLAKELRFKPRAFKEGKFAFGNTPDAMAKTVISGVPGQEVPQMPAFKSVLSDAEVHAVVDYVRTLMPPMPELTPADMKMEVTERAKIVRGILAPLPGAEGSGAPLARGLLVGLPGGFSFEYATDDFRLLAVRRGEFVTRSDWDGRGGRPLTPLGTVVATVDHWRDAPQFALAVGEPGRESFPKLDARLRSTRVAGPRVALVYELVDAQRGAVAEVTETPLEEVVAGGAGFTQEFSIRALKGPATVKFVAARMPAGLSDTAATGDDGSAKFHVIPRADGASDCVMLRTDSQRSAIAGGGGAGGVGGVHFITERSVPAAVDLVADAPLGAAPVVIRRTVITRKEVTPAALARMQKELRP